MCDQATCNSQLRLWFCVATQYVLWNVSLDESAISLTWALAMHGSKYLCEPIIIIVDSACTL